MEIDPLTLACAEDNLKKTGYRDLMLIRGDSGRGYPEQAPCSRICLTATCADIPPSLLEQLKPGGRLIAQVRAGGVQVTLRGKYGK
jgi:protein-L-isoaspartate(D-aspartate) O-methyltransferase